MLFFRVSIITVPFVAGAIVETIVSANFLAEGKFW